MAAPGSQTATAVTAPHTLSARRLAQRIAQGEMTAEAAVAACLDRIAAREGVVHAWSFIDPELALRQARALDRGPSRGVLHGVPVGIKDVIDTADMPTEMGSPIYKGHRPTIDAACVAQLRAAGAVILGKTVTAEFAGVAPGPTANPYDPTRTPGGSSSGSAAAVADGMVPVALGTQTGGSVHRPSSFCGVVGYKPSYGAISRAGLKLAAETLDTIGVIGCDLDDVDLTAAALMSRTPASGTTLDVAPCVGLCRTPLWTTAQPETVEAIEDAAARLAQAGAKVSEVVLPAPFTTLSEVRDTINGYERARSMAADLAHHADQISPQLTEIVRKGLTVPYDTYLTAIRLTVECRAQLAQLMADYDVLLAPCVPGEAPVGLGWTGDTRFQSLWTMLHVPTMSLPTHTGPNGLPVSIQLVAPLWHDLKLFAASRWIFGALGPWNAA